MIVIDLKLALFMLGLSVLGVLAGFRLLARRGAPLCPYDLTDRRLFDLLPFGIVMVESDGTPGFINSAAQNMLGLLDQELCQAIQALLRQDLHKADSSAPQYGTTSYPLPVRWWRYPLTNQHTLLILADERDHKRFIQQQQMFLGHLSHELRTPLTSLLAHIEIACNQQTGEPVRNASLSVIQRETQRIVRLVRDLLELHRLEIGDDLPLQPTNLVLVAEDAVAQVIYRAEERGQHIVFGADTGLLVLAQPDRLKQVFLNLLDNAIKYCRPGDSIHVHLEAQSEGVRCVVKDTGPGIAPEHLPHVTERLYRCRTDTEGSGLGLALVSEILRHHGAWLEIESSTEQRSSGTAVSWTLQYAAGQTHTA